jgi:nicotinamide mononucleotide transporter
MVIVTQTAFHFLGEPVSWAELLGFVTGIACVALAVARRIENFPVGIANNVFFLVLFADARLFADASLQVVYLVLGVMGWWAWLRLGPRRGALRVDTASPALLAWAAVGVAAGTLALVPLLRAADDSAPVLDALTTAISLGAQFLLNLKKLENWYVWIAVDVIYVPLYLSRDLTLTALVYVVFLGLCVAGWRQWRLAL